MGWGRECVYWGEERRKERNKHRAKPAIQAEDRVQGRGGTAKNTRVAVGHLKCGLSSGAPPVTSTHWREGEEAMRCTWEGDRRIEEMGRGGEGF